MIKIPLSGIYFQLNSGHKHFFRIMRITYASLFAAAFCLHAGNSYSQKVTLQGENLSVKEYMTAIEKQTEYLFIYDEDVNVDKKMSIDMVGRPVKEVLDNFASQLGITYTQKGAYIVLSKTQPNTSHNASTTIAQQEKKDYRSCNRCYWNSCHRSECHRTRDSKWNYHRYGRKVHTNSIQ